MQPKNRGATHCYANEQKPPICEQTVKITPRPRKFLHLDHRQFQEHLSRSKTQRLNYGKNDETYHNISMV